MSADLEFETLRAGERPEGLDADLAAMTFPIYRPLLDLRPASRHPEQGDARTIQPVAVLARRRGLLQGLALAELPVSGGRPELLSLFVRPAARNGGVGTALLAALERELAKRGAVEIGTVYTTGKAGIDSVERILEKRGWETPVPRTVSVRFPPAAALALDLFSERRMKALSQGLEIFPWRELDAVAKSRIRSSHEAAPWITPALAPWRFEGAGFDPDSSVGARYRGEVVGWVINHVVAPGTVRFTCSFLRKDLSRRSRIVPLYRESLARQAATGVERATFITPVIYPNMLRFIDRWLVPIAEFVGQTRGSAKKLRSVSSSSAT